MKFKPLEFISKANQVLLFLLVLFAIIFLCKEFLKNIIGRYEPPRIQIVKNQEDQELPEKIIYKKEYHGLVKDVYIIEIISELIDQDIKHQKSKSYDVMGFASSQDYIDKNTVNLMFVSESQPGYMLFRSDRYIRSFKAAKFDDQNHWPKISKNLYMVVDKDTNADGYLSHKDQSDLYVSEYNGDNLQLLLKNVNSYEIVRDNYIIISKGDDDNREFYVCDLNTGLVVELDTKIVTVKK